MALVYLVIDKNKKHPIAVPYATVYQTFSTPDSAIKHAESCGYKNMLGMGLNLKPGIMNTLMCGDVDVTILALEVQS